MLDVANTGVARGKVYLAEQKGLPIPVGWAINAAGAPTTDPAEAIEGIILPMAQHEGYAIAVMMDMLSGVLTGSAFGTGDHGPYQRGQRSGAGQFVVAVDIAALQPLAASGERMERYIAELKGAPPARGFEEIVRPGEIEVRNDVKSRGGGFAPTGGHAGGSRKARERVRRGVAVLNASHVGDDTIVKGNDA